MTPIDLLNESIQTMQGVLNAPITDKQQTEPTPCADFDVARLGDHIIDTHNLLLVAAGGTAVTTSGPLEARHAAVAAAAVDQWSERGTEGAIDIGGNVLPASFGLSLHTLEVLVHAWDLAQSLGRPIEPSPDAVAGTWEIAQQIIADDFRGPDGPYGAAVTVDGDAPLLDQLIAHTGRDPYAW